MFLALLQIKISLGPDLQFEEITGRLYIILSANTFGKPSYSEVDTNKSLLI